MLNDLKPGENVPEKMNLIVSIPKGSNLEYKYNNGYFKVNRKLEFEQVYPSGCPGDYGFIPKTHCDNGEPLDCITLVSWSSFPGIVREIRPIGVLRVGKDEVIDEKLIGVSSINERFKNLWNINDLEKKDKKAIEDFFKLLNKNWKIKHWKDKEVARKLINHSINLYKRKFR